MISNLVFKNVAKKTVNDDLVKYVNAVDSHKQEALDLGDKEGEKVRKLQTFGLSYFIGKSCFDDIGLQNYFKRFLSLLK